MASDLATPLHPSNTPPPTPVAIASDLATPLPAVDLLSLQDTLVQLYEQVNRGIVAIRVLTQNGRSLGSGFVIDEQGHIVTNYHVVSTETSVEVDFVSGYKTRGEVIGIDPDADLAVVKVDAPTDELHPLVLGDSEQVGVGQIVVAIGNPFGLEGTMTIGIVSGLGRTIRSQREGAGGSSFTLGDVIQTDAAINPGNSGGPLFNLDGEVIGINESILTNTYERTNSGVGFAVSIDIAKRIVPVLIASGRFDYPYLGIFSLGELTLLEQEALGLPRSTGVYVTDVEPGGPAELAGIRPGDQHSSIPGIPAGGDLIIAVDGRPVLDFNDLIVYVTKNKAPGDVVVLTVLRGDQQIEIELTLGKRPSQ
ncbi:MAG: trypsin-like peptidase domain-containing protein [Anaerolineales bacterium]|nr:trypsin-like peptidase domain-containing protein [Anaerolineales bacterium]